MAAAVEEVSRAQVPVAPAVVLRPVLVNGAMGMVVTLAGQPVAVVGFTFSRGKITEIDVLADPERLRRLDVAGLA